MKRKFYIVALLRILGCNGDSVSPPSTSKYGFSKYSAKPTALVSVHGQREKVVVAKISYLYF